MYEQSAHLYDLLNAATGKDYRAEAAVVAETIRRLSPSATSLLDVACGTGMHLEHLRQTFQAEGLELEEEMRQVAEARLPGTPIHAGDMRRVDLRRQFDVVTCLYSAIGYMLTTDDLRAAIAAMASQLAPGGVLLVEPWFRPDQWIDHHVVATAANAPDLAVARVSRSERSGNISSFTFHYTVATRQAVYSFEEPHQLALWTVEEYEAAFSHAGLRVSFEEPGLSGRGLFVGHRR